MASDRLKNQKSCTFGRMTQFFSPAIAEMRKIDLSFAKAKVLDDKEFYNNIFTTFSESIATGPIT